MATVVAVLKCDLERQSYYRARYYDSPLGRFISEDPIRFDGGMEFYNYVGNNTPLFIDPTGLWKNKGVPIKPEFPDPTIVCDGHGSIRPWFPLWYDYPPERRKCIGDCTVQHEESHKKDALRANPKICAGSPDGTVIGYSNLTETVASETTAWTLELSCLQKKKNDKNTCPACMSYIQDEIDQANMLLYLLTDGRLGHPPKPKHH